MNWEQRFTPLQWPWLLKQSPVFDKIGLRALSLSELDIAFKEENLPHAANYDSRISATNHPMVKLEWAKTVVSKECERLIGYEVSPAWLLVSEPDWPNSIKEALLLYVKEELAASPSVIESGNYLRIFRMAIWNTILFNLFAKDS